MRRRVSPGLVAATLAAALLAACSSGGATSATPDGLTVVTAADLPAATLQVQAAGAAALDTGRLVVLAEGAAELVAALGFADRVVGRGMTGAETLPEVPVVAPGHAVNAEAVLALRPTAVLVDERVAPASALEALRRAGIPVVALPTAESMATARERLRVLAGLLGVSVDTTAVYPEAPAGDAGPAVAFLYLRGTSAIYLVGGRGSGADDVVAAAGGTDIGAAAGLGPFTPLTPEALAGTRVDVLLVMTKGLESVGGLDGLRRLPGVGQTAAATAGRVIAVDDDVLLSFGLRTAALVERLRRELGGAGT